MKKGWEVKALGDICDLIGGGTPSKKNTEFYTGNIPWATIRDLSSDFITATDHSITEDALKNSSSNVIPSDNVVIATRVGLGKICLIKQDTAINQDLRGVIPKKLTTLDVMYLFYWFKSIAEQIVAAGTGATVQGVKVPFVKSLKIPIPPLSEQEEIVEVLDKAFAAIDQAKANIEQNIANAKELFQSKLNQIFSQKGEGWVETTLGEVIKIKHGFAFKSQFFTTEGDHVLLTPGNYFEDGGYRDRGSKQKYYDGEIPDGYILEKDDLLLAMIEQAAGLLGSPLLVPESNRFLHNQRLGLVEHISDRKLPNRFLYHAFNTKSFRQAIHDSGTGVKVRHTSPTKICEISSNLTFDTQIHQDVVRTLEILKTQTEALEVEYQTKLASLDELKKSILQKAFAGELTES